MSDPAKTRGRASTRARFTRSLVAPFLAVLFLLLLSVAASAHAQVVALDPVDGARLPISPTGVSITFNENVSLAPGGLRVIRPDGSLADVGDEIVAGPSVRQPISHLTDGWYVMAWSIISADGHVVHGSATFAVGDADAAARPASSSLPSWLEVAVWASRGLADLLLLVAAGAAIAWSVLGARTRRVRRLWLGVSWLGLAAAAVWLVIELTDGGSTWLDTQYAWSGLTRLALLAVSLALLLLRPPRIRAATCAIVVAAATLAWGGHSTDSLLTSLALVSHLLAAVTWLGAAPAVALVMWDSSVTDDDAAATVRAFSRLATVALVVLVVGGGAAGLLLTNGLEAGITVYVWILLAKIGVVGVAALMGAWGRRGLGHGARRGRYRRLFLLDTALLVVVVFLSAALTLVGPHQGHTGHEGHVLTSPRCSMTLGQTGSTFGAAVIADPGTPGSNTLLVSGVPAGLQGVTVELLHLYTGGSPITVPLVQDQRGWVGEAALPFTGDWTVTALVRVDTFTEARGTCDITIAP